MIFPYTYPGWNSTLFCAKIGTYAFVEERGKVDSYICHLLSELHLA